MVQWIIAEVMADFEVDPKDIVPRYRRHSVYGWGTFKCTECKTSWSSQITWVTLDIKEQRIRRRFKQKCKKCGQPQRPWWRIEEFAYMMEFALDRYCKLVDGTWKRNSRPPVRPDKAPHKSELCERCGFGSRKCWAVDEDAAENKDNSTGNTGNGPRARKASRGGGDGDVKGKPKNGAGNGKDTAAKAESQKEAKEGKNKEQSIEDGAKDGNEDVNIGANTEAQDGSIKNDAKPAQVTPSKAKKPNGKGKNSSKKAAASNVSTPAQDTTKPHNEVDAKENESSQAEENFTSAAAAFCEIAKEVK